MSFRRKILPLPLPPQHPPVFPLFWPHPCRRRMTTQHAVNKTLCQLLHTFLEQILFSSYLYRRFSVGKSPTEEKKLKCTLRKCAVRRGRHRGQAATLMMHERCECLTQPPSSQKSGTFCWCKLEWPSVSFLISPNSYFIYDTWSLAQITSLQLHTVA